MKAASRLKRIDKAMEKRGIAERPTRVIVCDFGEPEEEAIARSGYDLEDDFVIIVKFCESPEFPDYADQTAADQTAEVSENSDSKPDTVKIDEEISLIKKQLKEEDGLNDQQISDIVLEVEPMKADELCKIGR